MANAERKFKKVASLMPKTNKTLDERFWEKVRKGDRDECWEWTGARNGDGYGSFNFEGKIMLAHRAAATLSAKGSAIEDLLVCHSCDNRLCMNPEHFFYGTIGDNNKDRHDKGRSRGASHPGTSNPCAKVDWDAVAEIRSRAKSRREYSDRYGITYWTVRDIETGRTWRTQSSNTRARV